LEAIIVSEPIGEQLVPRGRVQFGLAGRGLWTVLDAIRETPAGQRPVKTWAVRPVLIAEVRHFGRHASGAIRDGVLRDVRPVELEKRHQQGRYERKNDETRAESIDKPKLVAVFHRRASVSVTVSQPPHRGARALGAPPHEGSGARRVQASRMRS
jgi:hypothetical protein